ncbi:MAG: hypothetical protein Q8S26_08170 [Azonexus sp.]|nr:hypothetical protein [Azonexus sp.]
MSRPAIKGWALPRLTKMRCHLDLGRAALSLQIARATTRRALAMPLKPSIPDEATLAALLSNIQSLCADLPAGVQLDITLSDALARCWIVERPAGLASPEEIDAMACDQMGQLYGDAPAAIAQWAIRLDTAPFASHWPAIALPRALLDLLTGLAGERDWQIGRVETRFVRSFNALRSNPFSRAKSAIYCLDTADGLTVGIRHAQQWQALRAHPPLAMIGAELPTLLRRDCRATGLKLEDCQVHTLRWQDRGALQ